MTPLPAFPRVTVLLLVALGACAAPLTPLTVPAPASAPGPTAIASAAAVGAAAPPTIRPDSTKGQRVVAEPTNDEVARTVVAVFGDSIGTAMDSANGAMEEPEWDLDVRSYETHERVAHYMRLFSGTGKERFVARLSRGTRYEPMIREKLRASGMPEDLRFLALIESGYDPHAYSSAAAVGIWQFMSSTARDVGLRVDWWVDERRDPARSTDAAIRFLGYLQKQFGSLYLAAAAYNGGPGRVSRGLTRYADAMEDAEGEDRFFALAEQDYLRAETKNYVPQLIAAALIAKMPARYGLVVDTIAPFVYDSVNVAPGTGLSVIATATGASAVELKDLNPAILRGITPPDAAMWVHVPAGTGERASVALDSLSDEARLGYRSVKVAGSTTTATTLAKREGVSVKQLRWFNPSLKTTKSGRLVAGQSIRIPAHEALAYARELPDPSIERYGGASSATLTRGGFHVVRRGETLGGIAKRYRLTQARLQSLNGMRGTRLIAGQTLRVSSTSRPASASKASSTAKKTTAKKTTTKKATAKKTTAKKTTAKKPTAKKPTAKKPTAKKTTAKASSKKSVAKRPAAKTSSSKKPTR